MDLELQRLMKLMPPLKGQRHTKVDWARLEEYLGIAYPQSFKDFVSVYGSSHWFDMVLPIYTVPKTEKGLAEFRKFVVASLSWIEENQYDEDYNKLSLPVYPAKGGLFPFLNSIDGPLYCWLTKGKNPDRWPVYCWQRGPITILKGMTIAGMFAGFMERSPKMIGVWGDINDLEPHRIRIDDCCAD